MSKNFIFVNTSGLYEDASGFEVADHINVSAGAADAAKPVVLNASGKIDSTMIPFSAFDWKESARVASTANLALTGGASLVIDGITLVDGDRILLKDQTDASENGIYVVSGIGGTYALARSSDAAVTGDITAGMTLAIEEGTIAEDRIYILTTNDPIVVGTTDLSFQIVPVNTFTAGNGIDITSNVISVDLLDSDSGLVFAGGSSDELAIDWASTFTIDGADDKAFKASDLASTSNGEGAAIVGIEDASGYYAGNNVEAISNELEAQIGGDTSSTYDFSENNVLADDDAIYAALNKLDLKWGDLGSSANGEGASLVAIEDAAGYFSATDVEGALAELAIADEGNIYTSAGVAKGDVVYVSANDTVSIFSTLSAAEYNIGIAASAISAGSDVVVLRNDSIITGVLTAATAGDMYYWNGSGYQTAIPTGSGAYVWRVGVAKNATDLQVELQQVKRNA